MLLLPRLEQPPVAQRHVFRWHHSKLVRSVIDPLRGAFQSREIPDRRLVDHAVSLAIGPLAAPLFIAKRGNQSERAENSRQRVAVRNLGLCLHPMLVPVLADSGIGYALVRHHPTAGIVAEA